MYFSILLYAIRPDQKPSKLIKLYIDVLKSINQKMV